MSINLRFACRRRTAASWTSTNEVLYIGEIGFETDTYKFKIGDGVTAWNSLATYFTASGGGGGTWGSITGTLSAQTDLQSALDAKQASDADLTAIAALGPTNDDIIQRKAGAWTNRTMAQLAADLSLSGVNTGDQDLSSYLLSATAASTYQPLDSDLTTVAGLTPSNDDFLQRKAGAWANRTVAQVKTDLGLTGTNSGDQTSIVGITGSLAEFNAALTGADFATGGGTVTGASSGTNTGDQTSIVGISGTIAQFNTACNDADFATGGGTATGTNTGDQDLSSYATTAAVAAGYQPLDAQLTSIAGLSYTGNTLKVVRVNAGETDFELATISAGSGDVVGPASAVDHGIPRFDSTTGKLLQDTPGATMSDVGVMTLANGTITTSQPNTITQTWNAGAVTFTGKLNNFTSSASAAASLMEDWQMGGVSQVSFSKAGVITSTKNGAHAIVVTVSGQNPVGFGRNSSVGGCHIFGGAQATPGDQNADMLVGPNLIRWPSAVIAGWASSNVSQNNDTCQGRALANFIVYGSAVANAVSGGAVSRTEGTKEVTTIADATATTVFTVTVPNASHSAMVRVTLVGKIGAGGAIGAGEATGTISYDIAIARTAGVNAVATISAAYGSAVCAVAGATTITVAGDLGAISGAVGAVNTFTIRVTITKGGGASANHTCHAFARVLNANATGITIS